jgi:hypothetical protein
MLQTEINDATKLLELLKSKQINCAHKWDNSDGKYNPEHYRKLEIISGDFSQCRGSDYYPATEYVDAVRDRWTRTCTICGMEQHSHTQNITKVVTGAKF